MINPLLKSNNNIIIEKNNNKEDLINQCFTFDDFIKKVPQFLKILSIGLSKDQILFQKIFLIMNENIKEIKNNIYFFNDLFINLFFPSLSLIDPCPSLLVLIWNYLSNFDYIERYKLYEEWLQISYKIHPYLVIKSIVVYKETLKWQKTLCLENTRKHGRILQIITNSNPIIAFDSIINLLILYENQITTIISAFGFCSSLSYDIITYIICKILNEKKSNLDQENIGIDKFFKNFCDFISSFYKKYYNSEINGVFNYIIDKFYKIPMNMDIYILKELIEKMTGIYTQEELNEEQILSECGGYKCYLESKALGKEIKSLKKPTLTLMKIIKSNDNLICLYLLLNLQKRKVLYTQKLNFQLMSFLYDQIHLINLQFQKMLNFHGKNEIYNKILEKLPVESLIKKYHFTPQIIFNLLRKKDKKIYELTNEEYINNCNNYKNIYDNYILHKKEFLENEFDGLYLEKEEFIKDFYKSFWTSITPELYYIFNSLELTDIFFPKNEYDKQIEDLNNKINQTGNPSLKNLKVELEGLITEKKNLITHHQKVLDFLKNKFEKNIPQNIPSNNPVNQTVNEQKDAEPNKQPTTNQNKSISVPMDIDEKNNEKKNIINKKELTQNLIQYLFFPRIIISKDDALYVQKLIDLLIIYKGDTINTIDILNKIPKFLLKALLCITESEAENIGIFLNSFLNNIQNYQNLDFWDKNCKNNFSFSRKLEEIDIVELNDFKTLFNEVIKNLTNSIEKMIENEKDNLNIRNIIIMINKIPIIPPSKEKAESLYKVLSLIQKKNQSQSFVLLESYKNELKKKFKLEFENNQNSKSENSNNSEITTNNGGKRDKSVTSKKSEGKFQERRRKERERDRQNRDLERRDKDREKDKSRDRSRDRSRDKSRDKSKDRSRDRSRERSKDKDRGKKEDKNYDKRYRNDKNKRK